MQQKPSSRFIRIAILALLVLGIIAFAQTPLGKRIFTPKKTTLQSSDAKNKTLGDLIAVDQNKNGIADWEERLYGLDPSVASTNGRSNKEIVFEKRAAAKDEIEQKSQTDSLASMLYATDSMLDGATLDPESAKSISEQLLRQTFKTQPIVQHTIDDIRVVKTTPASLSGYTKAITSTINTTSIDDPMANIAMSVNENTGFDIKALESSIKEYQDFTQKLVAMRVPAEFAQEHLLFINSIKSLVSSLGVMSKTDISDKVALVGAVASYRSSVIVAHETLAQLQDSLVQYTNDEN